MNTESKEQEVCKADIEKSHYINRLFNDIEIAKEYNKSEIDKLNSDREKRHKSMISKLYIYRENGLRNMSKKEFKELEKNYLKRIANTYVYIK